MFLSNKFRPFHSHIICNSYFLQHTPTSHTQIMFSALKNTVLDRWNTQLAMAIYQNNTNRTISAGDMML